MDQVSFLKNSDKFSKLLALLGAAAGGLAAVFALSGDADNQVNLFWLLFLFVLFPFVTLIFSVLYTLRAGKFQSPWLEEAVRWLSEREKMRWWFSEMWEILKRSDNAKYKRYWFIYQAQIFYMVFSAVCVAVYLLILTFSQVTFLWSSTLFEARHFLPALDWIAWPWSFWQGAQPSLGLLECTREFDLDCSEWHWWRYVLMALVFYSLIPRVLLGLGAYLYCRHCPLNIADNPPPPQPQRHPASRYWESAKGKVSKVVDEKVKPQVQVSLRNIKKAKEPIKRFPARAARAADGLKNIRKIKKLRRLLKRRVRMSAERDDETEAKSP